MTGWALKEALEAAGFAVDKTAPRMYCVRITRAEIRTVLGDKNWNPAAWACGFDVETGLFHFKAEPPHIK